MRSNGKSSLVFGKGLGVHTGGECGAGARFKEFGQITNSELIMFGVGALVQSANKFTFSLNGVC